MTKEDFIKLFAHLGYSLTKVDVNDIDLYSKLYEKSDIEKKRFYNIGAGLFRHPCWTNIDCFSDHYKKNVIDINYNLLEKESLPLTDESANIVYSSHTIEHIPNDAAQHMFDESYRILKKNGFLRITAPDIDLHYYSLINNDLHYWKRHLKNMKKKDDKISLKQLFLHSFASQTSIYHPAEKIYKINNAELNEIFTKYSYKTALDYCVSKCSIELQQKYPSDHINWWNKEKLLLFFQHAGFEKIFISGYGQSICPVLRNILYFDCTYPTMSLYVEAIK